MVAAVSDNILPLPNPHRASGFHLMTGGIDLIGNIVNLCPSGVIPRQVLPYAGPVIGAVQCDDITCSCAPILKQSHLDRLLSGTANPLFPHIDIRDPCIRNSHPIDA